MELIWYVRSQVIPTAYGLLPGKMGSDEAAAMLLAVGLQESGFAARRQAGNGPAKGFWQFERNGGVAGVLEDRHTGPIIIPIANMLLFSPTPSACHEAIENNDVLAACFARLLLYIDPATMPGPDGSELGWAIYARRWRPGKPRPAAWPANFACAWSVVREEPAVALRTESA